MADFFPVSLLTVFTSICLPHLYSSLLNWVNRNQCIPSQYRRLAESVTFKTPSNRMCSRCNKVGHNKNTCPQTRTSSICKGAGHNAATCPLRQRIGLRTYNNSSYLQEFFFLTTAQLKVKDVCWDTLSKGYDMATWCGALTTLQIWWKRAEIIPSILFEAICGNSILWSLPQTFCCSGRFSWTRGTGYMSTAWAEGMWMLSLQSESLWTKMKTPSRSCMIGLMRVIRHRLPKPCIRLRWKRYIKCLKWLSQSKRDRGKRQSNAQSLSRSLEELI